MKIPLVTSRFEGSRVAITLLRLYAVLLLVALPVQLWTKPSQHPNARFAFVLTGLLVGLVQLATLVHFGSWFKTAYAKLPLVGVRPRYTPAMAFVQFFIPFANLFRPSVLIEELYQGFDPKRLRPDSRRRHARPVASAVWWYLLLASSIAADLAVALNLRAQEGENSVVPIALGALAQLLAAAAAFGATRFVQDIHDLQRACAALLRIDGRHAASGFLEDERFHETPNAALVLRFFLGLSIVFQGVMLALTMVSWLDEDAHDGATSLLFPAADGVWPVFPRTLALLFGVCTLVSVVAFLTWILRTAANLRRVTHFQMSQSVTLGFFVPVYNLVHAWRVLRNSVDALDELRRGNQEGTETGRLLFMLPEEKHSGPDAVSERSIDFWLVFSALQLASGSVIQWMRSTPDISRDLTHALFAVNLGTSILSVSFLMMIVAPISRRMASVEALIREALASALIPARVDSLRQPAEPVTRASWKEVLLPIAASVDEGLRNDPIEARQLREAEERAKVGDTSGALEVASKVVDEIKTRVVAITTPPPLPELTSEQRAEQRESLALEQHEQFKRRLAVEFSSANGLTKVLRILLLFALFVSCAEAFYFFVVFAIGRWNAGSSAVSAFFAVLTSVLFGAAVCGLPSWLLLARWLASQARNGNALGVLAMDPASAALRALSFREPSVIQPMLAASSSAFPTFMFRRWQIALRLTQTAPIWLTMSAWIGGVFPIGGAVLFLPAAVLCISDTASFVREINAGLERIHAQGRASVAASSTARVEGLLPTS